MTDIAIFHSVLGVRAGEREARKRLEGAGHRVLLVDQYDGRSFADYDEAFAFAEAEGSFPVLMQRALDGVTGLPDGFLVLGFSNGGGMAEYVATQRAVGGAVLCSGALPVEMLGAEAWPHGVPAQLHQTAGDPRRNEEWVASVVASVRAAEGEVESFEYAGSGHLFADAELPAEYQPEEAELMWSRVLAFCDR